MDPPSSRCNRLSTARPLLSKNRPRVHTLFFAINVDGELLFELDLHPSSCRVFRRATLPVLKIARPRLVAFFLNQRNLRWIRDDSLRNLGGENSIDQFLINSAQHVVIGCNAAVGNERIVTIQRKHLVERPTFCDSIVDRILLCRVERTGGLDRYGIGDTCLDLELTEESRGTGTSTPGNSLSAKP